ncbi:ferritin-like fold-containing protein [Agromyces sp. SYSU T0242]|uniref:ferritin-like fold-containing protein n=1 Tax=Agromyces litoreus TaxID=3158561 RepID=UPI0033965470
MNRSMSRRPRPETPRLRPRVAPTELTRVDFTEITPEPIAFLGQAAYLQLEVFENLARAVATAPDLASKEGLSAAAGVALRKHHELIAEIRRLDAAPDEVMAPFAPALDRFRQATSGADWYELLLGIQITSGMLDDYFVRLAEGLPHELGARVRAILREAGASAVIEQELIAAIAKDPQLDDRLALWARSLVGDTLLIARSAIHAAGSDQLDPDVEPVFTELIASHTRRMDALGLTA